MKQLDLGKANINKIFISYVIPSILAMVAANTAMMIDTIFIGRVVGKDGLAALTLIMPVITIIVSVSPLIGIGGNTLAGIHRGSENRDKSNNFFNITLSLLTFIAIFITVIMMTLSDVFPRLLKLSENVGELASEYLLYVGPFVLFFLLPMSLSFFVKLDGKPLASVISAGISTVTNITLDYIFIVLLDMGIKGAALGTGLGQMAATLYLIIEVFRSDYWEFKRPNFLKRDIFAMVYNGSSEMLSMVAVAITGFIYNLIILKYLGEIGVSAYGIALQIFNFATVLFFGISDAIQSPISYNFGANSIDRVQGLRKISINTSFILGVVLGVICFIFGQEIASLFVKDDSTIEIASFIMKFYSISFVVTGVNIVLTTYYTAINQPLLSIILASSRSLVVVLISLLVLPLVFGEIGIWLPIITTEYVTAIIALVLIKKLPFGIKDNTHLT